MNLALEMSAMTEKKLNSETRRMPFEKTDDYAQAPRERMVHKRMMAHKRREEKK
jgi:hypothetical protein